MTRKQRLARTGAPAPAREAGGGNAAKWRRIVARLGDGGVRNWSSSPHVLFLAACLAGVTIPIEAVL